MANIGDEQKISSNIQAAEEGGNGSPSREPSVDRKVKDREEKLKLARDRQNEERQRKIEELKAQAEAAQRFREQKEEERKRRIDEIRLRDTEKRHQVEERKKAILAAENERREYILKKNQERESRLELKKRERISSAFAFGSSTPRLLEPAEFGMVSPSSFWSNRRSTSVSNVAGASITRRGSERELTDCGSKKRATSASGTERCDDDNVDTSHITFRSVARRKTDLMPTIPSPREGGGHYSSKSSLSNTPRTPAGSRSENVTPGGSMNASRPNSAMSTSTLMSVSGYVPRRTAAFIRKQRPISIAGTGVSLEEINKLKKEIRAPMKSSTLPPPAQVASKRTSNLMSSSMNAKSSSRLSTIDKKTTTLKKDPMSAMKSSTSKLTLKTTNSDNKEQKSKYNSLSTTKSKASAFDNDNAVVSDTEARIKSKEEKNALNAIQTMEESNTVTMVMAEDEPSMEMVLSSSIYMIGDADQVLKRVTPPSTMTKKANAADIGTRDDTEISSENASEMTASMIARNRITTEEEAKAALAEKRRLVREEAERQAELERQRLEAEYLAEMKRQEEEAERQRQFEEEAIRLAEEQRKAEDERLRQAIEEAKQREEEERRKREREEKQRMERYEVEKRAKEEAEKQRLEIAERLKREEKERKDRKKRVEAIMSRTRKTESAALLSNSTPTKENNASVLSEEHRKSTQQIIESMQDNNSSSNNDGGDTTSGSTTTATSPILTVERTVVNTAPMESPGSQAIYEQSVKAAEISLMKGFSAIIIDENTKKHQQMSQQQQSQIVEMANGRMHTNYDKNDVLLQNTTNSTVANGNGHIENINNKNDINILPTNQIIDITIGSQDINNSVNYNNNNNLLPTNTLVSADSHENSDISLL